MEILNYIESNKERILAELFEFIRIPSISSDPERKPEMIQAANFLKAHLLKIGVDESEVHSTNGHPVVTAKRIVNSEFPTVLIYGHYDVQPVDPIELWKSAPFEPEIRDGKIYARGADDDKGQLFMQLKAFEFLNENNLLKCNIKFIFEGEEEIGSPNLKSFIETHKDELAADIIMVSDTTLFGLDKPSITVGLRGLSYFQVEVTGPDRDLHSGMFGGAVANPINVLCKMIAQTLDENNHITIPGFYDDVIELSNEERALMAKAPFNEVEYRNAIGVKKLQGEKGYSPLEHTGIRPTFDVCGIWGGFTGEGAKTVLPSKAFAKVSMRLVPNQKYLKIDQLFEEYFTAIAPESVKVKVTSLHGGEGYVTLTDSPAYKAAEKAIEKVLGKKPVPARSGGSIPVIADFEAVLGIKSLLMGFGLDSDAIHSPNENYPLENFYKGIETITWFFKYYTQQ